MPSENTEIFEFNQNHKSDKAPFIIYADFECLIEKIDGCKNSPANSFTTKVGEHIPSGFSMSTISSFTKELHNPNWSQIPDHPYKILILGGSGTGKTNLLFNLIRQQPDIDKIHLYTKDPFEAKYQFSINKRETTSSKHLSDSKAFIKSSNDMYDIYKNIKKYIPNKKRKILIVFDDMIGDMLSNKELNPIVTEFK